jgi:hypothetical protein
MVLGKAMSESQSKVFSLVQPPLLHPPLLQPAVLLSVFSESAEAFILPQLPEEHCPHPINIYSKALKPVK